LHAASRRFDGERVRPDRRLTFRCLQRLVDELIVEVLADHHAGDQNDNESQRSGKFCTDTEIGYTDHCAISSENGAGRLLAPEGNACAICCSRTRLALRTVERRAIERTSPELFSSVIECRLFESKVFNGHAILIVN
jgi:hypothetical protein